MDLGLKGLKAFVTGSTAGIGAAIAETFAREGCDVAICSRSQDRVDAMLQKLAGYSGKHVGRALDVTDEAALKDWIDAAAEQLGGIDLYVANVSAMTTDWRQTVTTDILGTVSGIDSVLPHLLHSSHGSIVYISSIAGIVGVPQLASYGAAKAAMTHYMKSLAVKLVKKGVRVNSVAPGDIMFEGGVWDRTQKENPEFFAKVLKRNPMGRLGDPQEIADVVAFVSSPAASFVTGTHIVADGGNTQHVHF
jgi:3-oxoacyl-[acyl-carrier protein] reductase